jgi:hypothetical protein
MDSDSVSLGLAEVSVSEGDSEVIDSEGLSEVMDSEGLEVSASSVPPPHAESVRARAATAASEV